MPRPDPKPKVSNADPPHVEAFKALKKIQQIAQHSKDKPRSVRKAGIGGLTDQGAAKMPNNEAIRQMVNRIRKKKVIFENWIENLRFWSKKNKLSKTF